MITNLKLLHCSQSLWLKLAIVLSLTFCAVFIAYVKAEKQIVHANELRFKSYALADEMRQSSDDLTHMIRTYVVNGNPLYKKHYQEILDIRDGKAPRPVVYNDIYWDLVLGDDVRPRVNGPKIPLLTLMKQAGFTVAEFAKLSEAKLNSDILTSTEFAAINLVESGGSSTVMATNRANASMMLNDAKYHHAKAGIMRPLSDFYDMMDARTLSEVHYAETFAFVMRIAVVLFGLLFVYILLRFYRALNATLGGSVDVLHGNIAKIGSGNFSSTIPVRPGMESSVMGWLSETQIKLALIDADRQLAEARNQRQTQLYEVLSQCNQAIVRSVNAEELFPEICKDTVVLGGIKMAWIGLFDERSQLIKPVASYGTGVEYVDQIEISVDGNALNGRGPCGTAFREDVAFWCLDFQNDPATELWHKLGGKFGWGASVALPLHCNGKVIGIFNIYASDKSIFDEAGRSLLLEMSSDIDYALDKFQMELERVEFEDKLLESEERARLVLENSIDAIINMDAEGNVIAWNAAASRMFGYTREDVLGRTLSELIVPARNRDAHNKGMQHVLATHQSKLTGRRVEVDALRSDGTEFPVEMSIAQIRRGDNVFFSSFIRDITERRESESQIQRLAHFDMLTGLPNRSLLQDHFKYALSLVKRNNGKLVVIFIDLDHFKDINDTLGHSVGDVLLKELASRLQSMLREEDTLSRLGGDEFILILPGTDAHGAANVSQKLLSVMAQPYQIAPYELTVTGSIGIALYPEDGTDLEWLSQKADTAMYRAKQEGRNSYRFFTAEMQATSVRNLQLITALRHALDLKQLSLNYQPQLSMHSNRTIGVEALLRWYHPEFGAISPAEFIPIAEDSGLIQSIGEWVLREAVQQAKAWMDAGHSPLIMAVNLSATQFRNPDLPDMVTRILNEFGLAPEYLELELTEGVAMHDPIGAIAVMDRLHELGIRMSIDDFGTGYSSLSYLKKFKVYKLKIDQSFVRDISTDPEDKAIVSAVISMARSLGLQTIAEGVETKEQLNYLREQGCDEAQGYYYSKPITAKRLEEFLETAAS